MDFNVNLDDDIHQTAPKPNVSGTQNWVYKVDGDDLPDIEPTDAPASKPSTGNGTQINIEDETSNIHG